MSRESAGLVLALPLASIITVPACSSGVNTPGWADASDAGNTAEGGDDGGPGATDGASSAQDSATTMDAGSDGAAPIHCNQAPLRGANVPYQEYELENGSTNGTVLGPSRAVNDANVFNSIAGESSGRMAVELTSTGQYARVTTACTANSIVLRYVIPDSGNGSGTTATLGLYVNGTRVQTLSLTSQYAWAYGDPTASDTTTNNPGDGFARHFYDEVRVLLPSDLPAGSTVGVQRDSQDTAQYYVVDFLDLEEVAPALAQPAGSLSLTTDCGATPDDSNDDGNAIASCLAQASSQGKTLWIPPGTFENAGTQLKVSSVTVQGAGMWRSTIEGASAWFICSGGPCSFSDFSLNGSVNLRNDMQSIHAFVGSFGSGSRIQNVWMEHFTTGPWIGQGNTPAVTDMLIHGCRMRDLYADGVNLNTGTSSTTVEQCNARSTGDDAFASWSTGAGNSNNVFQFDTAQLPWRASCYALYGGNGNAVQDSVCADGITYPGIFVDQDFGASAFSGNTNVLRSDIVRTGGSMFGKNWGAVSIAGTQKVSPITDVQIENVNVVSPTFSGVFIYGDNDPIESLYLLDVNVSGAGTYGIEVDPSTSGTVTATGVVVTSPGSGTGLNNPAASTFVIDRGGGDTGW